MVDNLHLVSVTYDSLTLLIFIRFFGVFFFFFCFFFHVLLRACLLYNFITVVDFLGYTSIFSIVSRNICSKPYARIVVGPDFNFLLIN